MKNIIIKTGIFLLPVIILALVFETMLRRIPNEYSYKNQYMLQHADSIQVLVLGSSHGYLDLNPAYLPPHTFNAALSSQSIDYDLQILQKYDTSWKSLKYIVLPVSYFTLFSNLSEAGEYWRVKYYMLYYQFHSSHKFNEYTEILCGSLELNLRRLIRYYLLRRPVVGCDSSGWAIPFPVNQDVAASGFEGARKHRVANLQKLYPAHKAILEEIIAFAKKKNARVLFFTAPAYSTYYNNLEPKQLALTLSTMSELVSQNSNTSYYNFLRDSSFTLSDFYDGDHLNGVGAEKMSKKIDSLLRRN